MLDVPAKLRIDGIDNIIYPKFIYTKTTQPYKTVVPIEHILTGNQYGKREMHIKQSMSNIFIKYAIKVLSDRNIDYSLEVPFISGETFNSVIFVDIWLPKYRCIIEIDDPNHETRYKYSDILKNKYFSLIGVNVIRILTRVYGNENKFIPKLSSLLDSITINDSYVDFSNFNFIPIPDFKQLQEKYLTRYRKLFNFINIDIAKYSGDVLVSRDELVDLTDLGGKSHNTEQEVIYDNKFMTRLFDINLVVSLNSPTRNKFKSIKLLTTRLSNLNNSTNGLLLDSVINNYSLTLKINPIWLYEILGIESKNKPSICKRLLEGLSKFSKITIIRLHSIETFLIEY